MKKSSLFGVIFILFITTKTQAQHQFPSMEFNLGINQLFTPNENFRPVFGYGAAAKVIFFSDKKLNLVSGLLFENIKYNPDEKAKVQIFSDENLLFSYYTFSIPLFLRLNPGKNNNLFIEIGPTLEYTPFKWDVSSDDIYLPHDLPKINRIYESPKPKYWEFGANLSIGTKFPINNQYFTFTTSYHNSISDLIKSDKNNEKQYLSIKVGIIINERN